MDKATVDRLRQAATREAIKRLSDTELAQLALQLGMADDARLFLDARRNTDAAASYVPRLQRE